MQTKPPAPKDIDEYLAAVPPEIRRRMEAIRTLVREAVPEAREAIKYGMPSFTLQGNLVHFAAYKQHIGIFGFSNAAIDQHRQQLAGLLGPKDALKLPHSQPLPLDVLRELVKLKARECLEAATARRDKGRRSSSSKPA